MRIVSRWIERAEIDEMNTRIWEKIKRAVSVVRRGAIDDLAL